MAAATLPRAAPTQGSGSDIPYAELHCHTNFSFLDGASSVDDLAERSLELGLSALAATDHQGLYGAVRFTRTAEALGLRPVVGTEIELGDPATPDPEAVVLPPRRRPRIRFAPSTTRSPATEGRPDRPRPERARLPGHRAVVKEDLRGVGPDARGPRLVLLARGQPGWRSLTRLLSAADMAGTKGVPRFDHGLLETHHEAVIALSGGRSGEIGRRLLVGDRAGARAAAERLAGIFGPDGFCIELSHHLRPDDGWLIEESVALAADLRLPVVVSNAVHYARSWDREFHDLLTAIRHGRTLDTLADLRRPHGEAYLKSGAQLAALGADLGSRARRAWREGLERSVVLAAACPVDLDFEPERFPGFRPPDGSDPQAYLERRCREGLRKRYGPERPAAERALAPAERAEAQLVHELDVIGRKGLAEFFLICADLADWARAKGIPAQGRGSAAGSIVTYLLGISRVEPLRHDLLFERFISETGTVFPDIDIDFSAERREEVIQHVYATYGPRHTGMVCNLVTYRARSAVREVGYALGFPRTLVDRVAKALETYDSVMVRRDLEADGGFAEFFRQPSAATTAAVRTAARQGLTDRMGRLDHARAGADARPRAGDRPRAGSRPRVADKGGPGDSATSIAWLRAETSHSAVARLEPEPMPQPRGGSTVDLSPWERWLEFCARIDGFPRHLSIHSGGMLITKAPLVDLAPVERATMPDRVVVQFDKRDVEALNLIKLDLLGLGMLGAMDKALRLIERDCGMRPDLERIPEDIPEVYEMICAGDTAGVFQIESRAQMQTLPKSRPRVFDDLVVEVAIIRPGPIQGNAVHPYLRRRQGLEPVRYLHPVLEGILGESLGVILYQEQVMRIAIAVAGFSAGESDAFRRAMGTWRSSREMEKLHDGFVNGAIDHGGMRPDDAEDLFRQCAAFASFGFAKSHAAAFARTAYESAFLKLFYPAQLLVGLIESQPMGFYPVEVLVNDAKRHGVGVLPVDVNGSSYRTTTEWVGPEGQPAPVVSSGCVVPSAEARRRWRPPGTEGWGVRLGLHLVKGIGDEHGARLDAERARGPYRSLADVVERMALPEAAIEQLIRAGALDSLGRPRREMLWQLREVAGRRGGTARRGAAAARAPLGRDSAAAGQASAAAGQAPAPASRRGTEPPGRPLDLRLPATAAPELPALTESERVGDAYGILGLDARRQATALFRPALDRLGAVPNAALADRRPGRVRLGGLVVTRQHPMTARGTVFLALEDETGMVNVTLWPDVWQRLRGVVRQHALLLIDGDLQREGDVVNVVAREVRSLPAVAATVDGPDHPGGVRQLGYAGMRRLG